MKQKALNALYTMNERTFNYQVWTDLILIKLHVKKKLYMKKNLKLISHFALKIVPIQPCIRHYWIKVDFPVIEQATFSTWLHFLNTHITINAKFHNANRSHLPSMLNKGFSPSTTTLAFRSCLD